MRKIKKTSKIIKNIGKLIFWITAWASVLVGVFVLLNIGNLENMTFSLDSQQIPIAQLDAIGRTTIILVFWLLVAVFLRGLWHAIKLFGLYEKGEIFLAENIKHIKRIGETLILWAIIKVLTSFAVTSVMLYEGLDTGINVTFNLTALMIGLLIYVISWVMDEGRKLREEHELTI